MKFRITMDGDTNKPVTVDIEAEDMSEDHLGSLVLRDTNNRAVARFRNWTWVQRLDDNNL